MAEAPQREALSEALVAPVNIEWTARSVARLGDIRDYIAEDAPVRADAFCERLVEATNSLAAHPHLGARLPESAVYRQLVIDDYRIVYRIDHDTVYVVTVLSPGMVVTKKRLGR